MLMAGLAGRRVSHDADWLVGAALCCRRAALESVATPDGPFDEGFFMYSEELDLCRRVKQAGWRVVYEPAALVIHHEGKSSEQVSTQRHIRFNTSKVRYWRKWFGPAWAEALRRYLLLEYRTQLWVERAKLSLGHKPALRSERIAAYRAVIASRLRPGTCDAIVGWQRGRGSDRWEYLETTMLATNIFADACEIGERRAALWQRQAAETGDPTCFRRWSVRELRERYRITPLE